MRIRNWVKMDEYIGKFNYLGGKQHSVTYENVKSHTILELSHYITPYGSRYSVVLIRHPDMPQGKWIVKQFERKSDAIKYAKNWMKRHPYGI